MGSLKNPHTASASAANAIETESNEEAAKFEMAISATQFGKFNYCLFLLSVPGAWTIVFEVTTMSYVFPAAQCDLDLSLHDKGLLNASAYFGMISGGCLWGFLSDTLGRKKIMITTYLLDGLMVIISGFSQNFTMLFTCKFLGGFFSCGAGSALISHLLEFHSAKYRARVQMLRGVFGMSFGTIILPLLGLLILPADINMEISNHFVLHSWNVYLLTCAIPPLLSGIIFIFLPESPKFLMTVGRNEEALALFEKIYSCNTGKNKEDFPIKLLVDETRHDKANEKKHGGRVTPNRTKMQALREGCQQIRPICFPPYLQYIILVTTIQSFCMLSIQTLRLWLPQIFQSINDYQHYNNGTADLCSMLKMINPIQSPSSTCSVNFSSSVYINTMIVASISVTGYITIAVLINKVGKKLLIALSCFSSGVFALSIFFAQNTATVLSLSSLFLTLGAIALTIIITVIVDFFPTTQRSFTIAVVMVLGRVAAMIGNVIFPLLLEAGCAPPFIVVGSLLIVSALLTILLPNTDLKPLE
ncbi:synaptic vesicle glycoprotein 2B-like isoform X2 [Tenebrio molitor]|uniref:synaptic vesicle glycoprotein 2B-like isoform X2 n=1 Tax=Tenebrio molitor TaxID=7067 RepID=UPI003624AB5C